MFQNKVFFANCVPECILSVILGAANAVLVPQVDKLDDSILALAGVSSTTQGTGGMVTKLRAAEICLNCGCQMVIANGSRPENLYDILDGKAVGTRFGGK